MSPTSNETSSVSQPQGRSVRVVASELRRQLIKGKFGPGDFLPTERDLALLCQVAKMTARRALKQLEQEGLLLSVPRKGYRVLGSSTDEDSGSVTIAYIQTQKGLAIGPRGYLASLQRMCAARRWGVLLLELDGRTEEDLARQVRQSRVGGVILGVAARGLLQRLQELGVPVICEGSWPEAENVDIIMPDGYHGAIIGTSWLLERGHRRIAFVGRSIEGNHSQAVERFAGTVGALAKVGLSLSSIVSVDNEERAESAALALLEKADRPTGILAPWLQTALGVVRAVRKLNLTLGRDVDVVGWCTREQYQEQWIQPLAGGSIPPVLEWSVEHFAETMVARLAQRIHSPRLPVIHMRIPVSLHAGS